MISTDLKKQWVKAAQYHYAAMILKQDPSIADGLNNHPVEVFAPSANNFSRLIRKVLKDTDINDETVFAEKNREFIKGQFLAMAQDADPKKIVKARTAAALLLTYEIHCRNSAFTLPAIEFNGSQNG